MPLRQIKEPHPITPVSGWALVDHSQVTSSPSRGQLNGLNASGSLLFISLLPFSLLLLAETSTVSSQFPLQLMQQG